MSLSPVSLLIMASSSSQMDASQFLQQEEEAGEYDNPYQVYRRLIDVVINETVAPEVLPYEEPVVDCIVDQVQYMQDNLKSISSKLGSFCVEQHQMELERFRFVINKYYRTRLEKIERNAANLVKMVKGDPELAKIILSRDELKFLDRYVSSVDEYLSKSILQRLPVNMQNFHLEDVAQDEKKENDAHYVFVKALKKVSVVVNDPRSGQEVVNMEKGAQHFLPFSAIRPVLLKSSQDIVLL